MIGPAGLVLLAGAGVGYWAYKTRDEKAMRFGDIAAAVGGVMGVYLLTKGNEIPGLVALCGAGWWYWARRGLGASSAAMSPEEARRVLDLPNGATDTDIKAAHRRLIARVHPDAGGSVDLTRQVNAARDVLMATRRPI